MKYYQFAAYVGCILILCRNAESFVCRVPHAVPTSQHCPHHHKSKTLQRDVSVSITTTAASNDSVSSNKSESGECYYRRIDGPWRPRRELHSLFIGERLFATRLPSCDLLEGKTGPKVFLECGVGRKSKGGKWNIVNGMLRIPGKRGMKTSVARKKAKKISDSLVEVYVSKLRLDHGSFEVCLSREEALSSYEEKKIPCSSLKPGEKLSGKVKHIKDYGVFVDVGANRNGLIHISKVATAQNRYINKKEGLKSAGLARGSTVRVIVLNNEKKRLQLDLVTEEEQSPEDDRSDVSTTTDLADSEEALGAAYNSNESTEDISTEEADMWAAYAAYENVEEEEDEDYYDEDEEIEDALGIGSY